MARIRRGDWRRRDVLRGAGGATAQSRSSSGFVPGVLPAETAGGTSGSNVEHVHGPADGGAYYGSSDASLSVAMKAAIRLLTVVLALVGAGALVAGAWLMRGGINAKQQPGAVETSLARRLRAAAIPRNARPTATPVQLTPGVLGD